MKCKICGIRRARRFCPGVHGDICSLCCGTEREVTITCPFDCEYLREARGHERVPDVNPDEFPNRDIPVTATFLRSNEQLLGFTANALLQSAIETHGAIDFDVRDALDSLVRTYRTLESGLYYESLPNNAVGAAIHQRLQALMSDFRQRARQDSGLNRIRDAEVLGVLAFLQRLEIQHNNGRRRGRAFLDFLASHFGGSMPAATAPAPPSSSLIIP